MNSLYDQVGERNHSQAIALENTGLAYLGAVRDPIVGKTMTTFIGTPEDFVRIILASISKLTIETADTEHVIATTISNALIRGIKKHAN